MADASKITAAEFQELAWAGVPDVGQPGCRIERIVAGAITVRLPYTDLLHRPGGTICGPALTALADISLYGLAMSRLGRIDLVVTTDLTFHVLGRPQPTDVLADGKRLKLGHRLAVGAMTMHTDGDPDPICHATGTYAIPPPSG